MYHSFIRNVFLSLLIIPFHTDCFLEIGRSPVNFGTLKLTVQHSKSHGILMRQCHFYDGVYKIGKFYV